ncbi:MAG: hypothetical protein J1E83_13695 [Lachnospiraceae bacterium]|nr:hypothetical protein [Lachnospiraceae bacterium]
MSTLEKTIDLLSHLSENQLENIYSYVRFLNAQAEESQQKTSESLETVFGNIVGVLQDTGKSLEDYREERVREQYGVTH